jgi:CelD/BcsL family acetyltransferase involved in cellulose biosynthesis
VDAAAAAGIAGASLSFETAGSAQALAGLAREWDALHQRSGPRRNPFLGFDWTELCWRADCAGSRPLVLLARTGGELVGLAPLCVESHLGFRVARFIADRRSDYLGFLCAAGTEGVEAALLGHLVAHEQALDLVELRQLSPDHGDLRSLPCGPGCADTSVEGTSAFYVRGEGGWAELCKTGPHWLTRMRRKLRKFEEAGGTADRYLGAAAGERIEEAAAIEARSWKASRGKAQLSQARERELLREALRRLGDRGELELWIARVGGMPAAFELNFLTADWIGLYQGAHDEAFRHLGPGTVLELLSIRRAWEAGVREYDYLTGAGDYKAERTHAQRSVGMRILRPRSLRGEAAFRVLVDLPRRLRDLRASPQVAALRHRLARLVRRT